MNTREMIHGLRRSAWLPSRPIVSLVRIAIWSIRCVVRRPALVHIGRGGPRMRLEPIATGGSYTSIFVKRENYEPELLFLSSFAQAGDRVFDVGANIGVYALVLGHSVGPSGEVIAFEPGASARRQLASNATLNASLPIVIVPSALSNSTREGRLFHIGSKGPTFSLGGADEGYEYETIAATTLDAWAADDGGRPPIVIKIDVEGHEPAVLEGGVDVLRRWQPLLVCELSPAALRRNGYSAQDLLEGLAGLGYDCRRFVSQKLLHLTIGFEGNIVAVVPDSVAAERLASMGLYS